MEALHQPLYISSPLVIPQKPQAPVWGPNDRLYLALSAMISQKPHKWNQHNPALSEVVICITKSMLVNLLPIQYRPPHAEAGGSNYISLLNTSDVEWILTFCQRRCLETCVVPPLRPLLYPTLNRGWCVTSPTCRNAGIWLSSRKRQNHLSWPTWASYCPYMAWTFRDLNITRNWSTYTEHLNPGTRDSNMEPTLMQKRVTERTLSCGTHSSRLCSTNNAAPTWTWNLQSTRKLSMNHVSLPSRPSSCRSFKITNRFQNRDDEQPPPHLQKTATCQYATTHFQ